ncbi:MAG: redoxin domain-containing protein [Gammaproteobacteria bacterium]|nr:redoxin domain-containing protein [Gammaproteobacteria bacterium]
MNEKNLTAPELQVSQWFNSKTDLTLAGLRGKVIVLHAFQMLCPGCVQHGIPQAQRIAEQFPSSDVAVVGLHTVFEHHDAMTPVALAAFIHEYRLTFAIGVDAAGEPNGVPLTMQAYQMQGTPSLILVDRCGKIRWHKFGHAPDLQVGAAVATLVHESTVRSISATPIGADQQQRVADGGCNEDMCII